MNRKMFYALLEVVAYVAKAQAMMVSRQDAREVQAKADVAIAKFEAEHVRSNDGN